MKPGDTVADRFVIEREAGSGGMGTVYRAHDRATNGPVALKVLRAETPQTIERFVREGSYLAALAHPGIVRFVASGSTSSSEPYLAMEWLAGESLAARLARGPLSIAEVLLVARLVAEALDAAHAAGIIHRDLKPANVFLVDGRLDAVKVLDFGVARLLGRGETITATGVALGTPGFMSPEQARGLREIDAKTDLFSLACVLFVCLTGKPPFTGGPLEIVLKVVQEPAPLAASLRPDVPPGLDALLQRMLAKKSAERPESAGAVARELAALAAESMAARSTSAPSMPARSMPAPPTHVQLTSALPAPPTTVAAQASTTVSDPPPPPATRVTPAAEAPPEPAVPRARSRRRRIALVAAVGVGLVLIAGIVARVLVGGGGASALLAGGMNARYACAGALRCAPVSISDPEHADEAELRAVSLQLAQSVEPTSALCGILLAGAVGGTVSVSTQHAPQAPASAIMFRYAPSGRGGRSVKVLINQGFLKVMDDDCTKPVSPPACSGKAAFATAAAAGVKRDHATYMFYGERGSLGVLWELDDTSEARGVHIDGRTCKLKK